MADGRKPAKLKEIKKLEEIKVQSASPVTAAICMEAASALSNQDELPSQPVELQPIGNINMKQHNREKLPKDVEHETLMDRRMHIQATQGLDGFEKLAKVEHETLMDRRMYIQATQGLDGFKKVLDEISREKELQLSKILYQFSPQRNTCLHIAASSGHLDLASYMVKECPQLIKEKNSRGDTALHIAARRNDSITFVNIVIHSYHFGSAKSRDIEKAESLLRIVNNEENTVLHEALIHHCKEVAKVLIKADPQAAYCPNKEGKTPLYLAAEAQYLDVVEVMERPATEVRDRKAKPAVYGAILGKNKEMLEKILAMEPVHQTNDEDESTTPLHCAASIGYLEGVEKLLGRSNFARHQRDSGGFFPIHVASMKGHVNIVKKLLQFSPDSKELLSKHDGQNFLHVAARCGKDEIVNFVLKEQGLENLINEKDNDGNTPLHLATRHGRPNVVNYLTRDKRVDVNIVNNKGQTAFDIALSVERPPSFHQVHLLSIR